jgi:hypothetical protein
VNSDPVFEDPTLGLLDDIGQSETKIVRNLSEAVQALLDENFDGVIIEGDAELALEQATHLRQHFPSLAIACLSEGGRRSEIGPRARSSRTSKCLGSAEAIAKCGRRWAVSLPRSIRMRAPRRRKESIPVIR